MMFLVRINVLAMEFVQILLVIVMQDLQELVVKQVSSNKF